jgi:hypothetical protein
MSSLTGNIFTDTAKERSPAQRVGDGRYFFDG